VRRTRMRHEEAILEPNMTPLIDVCLVLVIILLVSTPMAVQSSIAVQRAAQSGKAKVTARSERVEITLVSPEVVLVNQNQIPRANLSGLLKPLLDASATKLVVVRCGEGISHGAFVSVLDDAKSCGASQIAVVGG